MRELLAELNRALSHGPECVYCAVVETRGSTPQKAGAAMLVYPDGTQAGTLGGGCVEAEVKRRALHVLNEPGARPEVLSFCLDDDYGWDDGLICGGRMVILADPLRMRNAECGMRNEEGPAGYYWRYQELIEAGRGCTEVVALADNPAQLPAGSRYLFNEAGSLVAGLAERELPAEVVQRVRPLVERPRPAVQKGFAYLPVLPRVTIFVVGGGHVGQAVAKLAAEVDFDVWVLDDREKYASAERFPQAERVLVGDIGRSLKEIVVRGEITPSVYCLIVTRGHNHDEEALYHLATTSAGYLGMIGSKRKIKLIYEDLLAKGVPEAALRRVHAPLGFDIGSQTVPEIAVSIVAELIAHRNRGASIPAARKQVWG